VHVLPQFLFHANSHTSLELGLQVIPVQPKVEDKTVGKPSTWPAISDSTWG